MGVSHKALSVDKSPNLWRGRMRDILVNICNHPRIAMLMYISGIGTL